MKKTLALAAAIFLVFALLTACNRKPDYTYLHEQVAALPLPTPPTQVMPEAVSETMTFGGVEWWVLEAKDGMALLVSEYILELRAYHDQDTDITWEGCELREYLNGTFFENAFSEEERSRIAETRVVNNDNPWFGTNGGSDTIDRIFLLSAEEAVHYFGDSGQLEDRPFYEVHYAEMGFRDEGATSISDEFKSTRYAFLREDGAVWSWWLRSPGESAERAVMVHEEGYISMSGHRAYWTCGVRPAMWIYL